MKKLLLGVVALGVIAGAGVLTFAYLPTQTREIALAIDVNDAAAIERGRYVATASDCVACHTVNGGAEFAGGRPIASPVGTMYSTNITPDQKTGIGAYTLNDFDRAVRHGIVPDGSSLYPAMPYPSYIKLTDQDLADLYAYFMKGVTPVEQVNKAADIPFPMSLRFPVAIWRKLFGPGELPFEPGRFADAELARGAYLVEGAAHCSTCHTPRGANMAELALDDRSSKFLAGGQVIDGAYAISLRADADGMANWTKEDIVETLRSGRNAHSAVLGEAMGDVVSHSLQYLTDADLNAIAAYIKTLGPSDAAYAGYTPDDTTWRAFADGTISGRGAEIYQDSCSACHLTTGLGAKDVFPGMAGNPSVLSPDPQAVVTAILKGAKLPVTVTRPAPMGMPGFAWRYSDEEVAELVTFLRSSWGNKAPAVDAAYIKKIRDHLTEEQGGGELAVEYDPRTPVK